MRVGVLARARSRDTQRRPVLVPQSGQSTLHIIMEYCGGGSLADAVAEQLTYKRPFDMGTVRRWIYQLTAALAHIHSLRVIHRDLKVSSPRTLGEDCR